MFNPDILFYALGALASLGFISSNYALSRKNILALQTVGSVAVGLQFISINIWSVALVNLVFIIRNIFVFSRESIALRNEGSVSNLERVGTGAFFIIVLVPVYFVLNSFPASLEFGNEILLWMLPLLAGLFNIIAIAQKEVIRLKFYILLSVSSWAVFDVLTKAWTTLIGDSFSIIACLIAIWRLSTKKV